MMKRALVHADFGSLRKSRRAIMRKTIVAAAALAAVLSLGASADRAAAMTAATPTELGLATADSGVVEKAALVCNRWGCRRVCGDIGPGGARVAASTPLPARLGVGAGVVL